MVVLARYLLKYHTDAACTPAPLARVRVWSVMERRIHQRPHSAFRAQVYRRGVDGSVSKRLTFLWTASAGYVPGRWITEICQKRTPSNEMVRTKQPKALLNEFHMYHIMYIVKGETMWDDPGWEYFIKKCSIYMQKLPLKFQINSFLNSYADTKGVQFNLTLPRSNIYCHSTTHQPVSYTLGCVPGIHVL